MVLDHGASDFFLKIINLALEANLSLSEMKPGSFFVLLSFLVGIPSFLTVLRGITLIAEP